MKIVLLICLIPLFTIFTPNQINPHIGVYHSVNNTFERWSTMELGVDKIFWYHYGVGGCQATVTGSYEVIDGVIYFKNDTMFTDTYQQSQAHSIVVNDSLTIEVGVPYYPDLSLVEWTVGRRSIKPVATIYTGCMEEDRKHVRREK